ncbi:MAG: ubiquinol-cytochrome C chaperone family protein, partial [Rhodospirillaceae bacterium]|nr:ubiquinol-cytochrome C chaperone family protein [Rhodospirillaceae bacterium]
SLREVGVGDMSIGKHIKKMAKAFYGRAEEYEEGLDKDEVVFTAALKNNLYRTATPSPAQMNLLMHYIREADEMLRTISSEDVCAGRLRWPQVRVAA